MDLTGNNAEAALMLNTIRQICTINPQLEHERNSILQPSNFEPLFRELISVTSNVHVGWLLSPAGNNICRELSILLDSQEPGWEDLATHLGFSLDYIRDIRFNRNLIEGPTYTVIWMYAYKDDATVGELIDVLYKLQRYDILSRLRQYVVGDKGLIELLQSAEKWNDSGFISSESNCSKENAQWIISKPKVPILPIKYQLFSTCTTDVKLSNWTDNISKESYCNESFVTRDSRPSRETTDVVEKRTKEKNCKAVIMLTFTLDGVQCANRVAAALRKKLIGVLILNEQRECLTSNPEEFITGCFQQVDYIVPIVTEGYLKAITATSLPLESLTSSADAQYVKLIYTLMAKQFVFNGCFNLNVRCILPEGSEWLMQEHPAVLNRPVLQAWRSERDVDLLGDSVLLAVGADSEE